MRSRVNEFGVWIIVPCMMRIVLVYMLWGFLVACVEEVFGSEEEIL